MAGARFDIRFAGELLSDADPDEVRRQLKTRFKLSEEAASRLFSGRLVTVKRGVDTATASRYREAFRGAGALVQIAPVSAPSTPPLAPVADTPPPSPGPEAPPPTPSPPEDSGLTLAPLSEAHPLERPAPGEFPQIDVSHLSLVPGQDWTLEDCQPAVAPAVLPDISHLRLMTTPGDDEPQGDAEGKRKS